MAKYPKTGDPDGTEAVNWKYTHGAGNGPSHGPGAHNIPPLHNEN